MANINVNIDVDDILWDLSDREKQELANELYDDGFVQKQLGGVHPNDAPTGEFDREVSKLIGNAWRLTKEDEETILRITNKLF